MKKIFNTTGPCYPEKHYMLPAQERCQGLLNLIEQEQYFVIHAARQSGKTTLLLDLVQQLNHSGDYYAMYCSLESVQGILEAEKGIPAIVRELNAEIEFHPTLSGCDFMGKLDMADFNTILRVALSHLCKTLNKPLVVLFDEIDCLSNGTLISFLRQLRYGYINRSRVPFVHSIALVGMRNIRDYQARIRTDTLSGTSEETLGSASPFNIVSVALTLRNFTQAEIAQLYAQHTEQSGQFFPSDVIETVYHYTAGQPWLVNAIAKEISVTVTQTSEVFKTSEVFLTPPIISEQVDHAIQTIIWRRDTHIDSLVERLKEERVRKIVEPVILGQARMYDPLDNDYRYVLDLGLLHEVDNKLVPANPLYGEVIIRTLNSQSQQSLDDLAYPPLAPAYLVQGKLDLRQLLSDFQQFWRENSEIWIERYSYKEAAPHLILQAFLQRVINSGGRITREMATGTARLDLCIHYQAVHYPLELKLRYSQKTYQEGVKQLSSYMDKLGCSEGWIIVFDRRIKTTWHKKIFWQTRQEGNKTIYLVGC